MKVASLSSSLLVRKGAARPSPLQPDAAGAAQRGAESPAAGRFTFSGRGGERAERFPPGETARAPRVGQWRNARGSDDRVRVTLRVSRQRHLQLRLAAAHLDKSQQQILSEALDRYLADMAPSLVGHECPCLQRALAGSEGAAKDSA